MKHNCEYVEDGETYQPFLDAVIDGTIEYDDFYDAYLWFGYKEKRFLFWKRVSGVADILKYCPYCGENLNKEKK